MRRSAERLRVTAQLVDAETGNHLWPDRFERPFSDLFALQDEIAAGVAKAFGLPLQRRNCAGHYADHLKAWSLGILIRRAYGICWVRS